MNSYDWELIELLLHKVQESANVNFAPVNTPPNWPSSARLLGARLAAPSTT